MTELELTPIEIACGTALGLCSPAAPLPPTAADPLAALEAAVEAALRRPPCLVSFSGGVDSSLVLAVAIRVARRRGLPEPIPITWRFTGAPAAEESRWQERTIAALQVADWERRTASGELDLVGPIAQRVLARHGLLHPANAYLHEPLLERAAGGTLLTGIGGDQVLGLWRGRALADVFARRRRPPRRLPLMLVRAFTPSAVVAARERRRAPAWPWLRPPARRQATRVLARERAAEPIAWAPHLRWQLSRRDTMIFGATLHRLAEGAGAAVVNPLLEPQFVAALARAGGRLGYGDRSATLAALFGEVLPRALLDRRDKAIFDEVFWGEATRTLTRSWDGAAVDEELVDRDALRAEWSTGEPNVRTALLVQQVWLNTRATAVPHPPPGPAADPNRR